MILLMQDTANVTLIDSIILSLVCTDVIDLVYTQFKEIHTHAELEVAC